MLPSSSRFARLPLVLLLAALLAPAARAQADPSLVTLDRLFASADFAPERVGGLRWADGEHYTRLEPAADGRGTDLVRYDAATGAREVLVAASRLVPAGADAPLAVEDYAFSPDGRTLLVYTNSARVWRANTRGDYWALDLDSGRLRQLGGASAAPSTLMFATFSPQSDRVAYVRENNLYVERLADGAVTALTTDGSRTTINGTFDWVYEEEFGLRNGFRWSPDGAQVAYWQLDATGIRDFLLINNTDSLYSFTIPIQYPKAGTTNAAARIGVVPAAGGATRWFRLSSDERNHYPARMDWAATSDALVVQHLNRLQNTNEVLLADTRTMTAAPILTERDDAWTDAVDDLVWFDEGRRFTWISDRDGWSRVYVVSRDGRSVTPVTPAGADVLNVLQVDLEGGFVYYIASPDNPTQRYLYRSRLDGTGAAERLSPADAPGTHSYSLAPGARMALHTVSRFGEPPTTSVVRLPDHGVARVLVANERLRRTVGALRRGRAEFLRLPADDGTPLDAWRLLPPDHDPSRQYPLLVYVYGEPAGTTVTDAWGGSSYLWHLMLAQQGYVVVSVDPRGTPQPRGRAWRKSIYGAVGVQASADLAAATRALIAQGGIDPARVAVWGWSGGGSSTLNAMFRYPEVFRVGMSVAPVPDQRLYDTIYQERYMGLPQDNPEGYRTGSPITFAEGLAGDLLLVHGTGDDNVHYQGTERLINRLVELGKPFDMMAYPNRSHGIYEGRGTTRHLYGLLTRYLTEHAPPGPAD